MRIIHVIGARPNFMKAAPVIGALAGQNTVQTLVHTGQHYDPNMSDIFFAQLGMPKPDVNLAVGSGSHAKQTADIMTRFEPVVLEHKPDVVVVYGDVNSTLAAVLVCAKLQVPVAHVEAGLRSFDRGMPEEINRKVTDQLADVLYTPSPDGDANLLAEGIPASRIERVGNVMIDTLMRLMPEADAVDLSHLPANYALVTLHRPSNVDDPGMLTQILRTLLAIAKDTRIVFPIHPRTRARIQQLGLSDAELDSLCLIDPAPYIEFLAFQRRARFVLTDSGGIQEETTFLGVPCVTLRENTERPVTVTLGTNVLVGHDMELLRRTVTSILAGDVKHGVVPELWDGKASQRIARSLQSRYGDETLRQRHSSARS